MKKSILLVALFALFSVASYAQVTFGVKGGVAMSGYMGDNSDNSKVKLAGRAGLGLEYAINDMVSIQPTLYWSDKGAKYDGASFLGAEVGKTTVNQMYLELPVDVQLRFNLDKTSNVVVAAGPYVAYGIGGKIKTETTGAVVTTSHKSDTFDKLKKWDMGLNFEAGLEFNQFLVGIYSEVGLINIHKGGPKNYTVGLNLGYRF
jgi:hypothetical protein